MSAPYDKMTDIELVRMYKESGGMDVLGVLFQRYTSMVYGVCLKYLKNREESKDAVMQIFEKLASSLHHHDITYFKSWLYATTRNHCLMQIRAEKGKNFIELNPTIMESDGFWNHDDSDDMETNLVKLERCMEGLKKEQKNCVRLFFLEQKCYKEITEVTGYDFNQVKSHIQNGKRNLKICLEQHE